MKRLTLISLIFVVAASCGGGESGGDSSRDLPAFTVAEETTAGFLVAYTDGAVSNTESKKELQACMICNCKRAILLMLGYGVH